MSIKRTLSDARVDQAIDERDDRSGAKRPGAIDYSKLGDIPTFKPKEDKSYKLNVIPYVAKNPLNPMIQNGKIAIGDLDLWLEVWMHRNIGADKAYVVCPQKMWGKKCPICDKKQSLYDHGDEGLGKKLQPSKRLIMYVQVFDKGEPQPIQLFEVAHYSFGQPLLSSVDRKRKEGKVGNFADPDKGNLVKFWTEKGSGRFASSLDFVDFEFLERDEEILDEDLDNPSLDEHLIVYTADELQAMLDETELSGDEDNDGREGRRERGSREGRRERGSRDDDREEGREGRRERGSRDVSEKPQDSDPNPRPSSDEAPKSRPVETVATPAIAPDSRCPKGHGWGPEATDKFPECENCSKWQECLEGA